MFDPISIGMMLAGSLVQAQTQQQAQQAQQSAMLQAQREQSQRAAQARERALASSQQSQDVAARQVQEFDPNNRQQKQEVIRQDLTDKFTQAAAAPITAQGVDIGQTIQNGGTDYLAAKGRELAKTTESNRNLASLLGRIGSAGELRRNEAVGIGDTAGQLGRIQTNTTNGLNLDQMNNENIGQADQAGINAAGQPSIGGMILGSALSSLGAGRMATAGLGKAAIPMNTGAFSRMDRGQVGQMNWN